MDRVEVHYGAATDVGQVRRVNEDSYLTSPPVFVVADGMGGHAGGDVASAIVVEEFARLGDAVLDPETGVAAVEATLAACQARINEYAESVRGADTARWYSGTTVVAALLVEDDQGPRWLLANLGDSRAYRLVDSGLEQVSVDHSVVQELVDSGRITSAQAATHPDRHVVTRALGGPDRAEADYFLLPLDRAGRLLLCSDGVTGMLTDDEVARILGAHADPRDAADRLVAAAVEAGGHDNATAIVVDVVGLVSSTTGGPERTSVSLEEKLGALP